jgi:hypothetical protein
MCNEEKYVKKCLNTIENVFRNFEKEIMPITYCYTDNMTKIAGKYILGIGFMKILTHFIFRIRSFVIYDWKLDK